MGISIGDKNKIRNSTIAENIKNDIPKKNFSEKHSVIISAVISFVIGFILLFSFWDNIILWIEEVL